MPYYSLIGIKNCNNIEDFNEPTLTDIECKYDLIKWLLIACPAIANKSMPNLSNTCYLLSTYLLYLCIFDYNI